jgi:integrase
LDGAAIRMLKHSTLTDYRGIRRKHLQQASFINSPIDKIRRSDIKKFLHGKLAEGYAVSTVTHMKNLIGNTFNEAIDDEVITNNPAHGMKLGAKKDASRKPKVDPCKPHEVKTLLTAFEKDCPEYFPFIALLVFTGARIGEAVSLTWGDIDFANREIIIQRSVRQGRIDSTKTSKIRRVDMTLNIVEILQNLRRGQLAKGMPAFKDAWLFPEIKDFEQPLNYHSWRKRVWYPMLKKASLRRVRIHDMRHCFVSLLISAGKSLHYIKEQVGHSSINVTSDIYGHWVHNSKDKPVDVLDDVIGMAGSRTQNAHYTHMKNKKSHPKLDNHLNFLGDPTGIRTRVTGVRGRRPNH